MRENKAGFVSSVQLTDRRWWRSSTLEETFVFLFTLAIRLKLPHCFCFSSPFPSSSSSFYTIIVVFVIIPLKLFQRGYLLSSSYYYSYYYYNLLKIENKREKQTKRKKKWRAKAICHFSWPESYCVSGGFHPSPRDARFSRRYWCWVDDGEG